MVWFSVCPHIKCNQQKQVTEFIGSMNQTLSSIFTKATCLRRISERAKSVKMWKHATFLSRLRSFLCFTQVKRLDFI